MKVALVACIALTLVAGALSVSGKTKPFPKRFIDPREHDMYRTKYIAFRTEKGDLRVENLMKEYRGAKAVVGDVTFRLTNHKNSGSYETLLCSDFSQLSSSSIYDPSLPNYFITHGWTSSADSEVNTLVRAAVLKVTNANVFVVDWSGPADEFYTGAKNAVPDIGKFVGNYINQMISTFGLSSSDFRLVGHSLGAHVSGCAGAAVNGLVKYIIGLDPAGPLFTIDNTDNRVDISDAAHVQIIHTNSNLLGFTSSCGHADFRPNGGGSQPGCGVDLTGSCSHGRSYEYLAESISSSGFLATFCESYDDFEAGLCSGNKQVYMGQFDINTSAALDYYLSTNGDSPYAKN